MGNGTSGARIGRGAVIRARGLTSAVQFDLVAFCDFFFEMIRVALGVECEIWLI